MPNLEKLYKLDPNVNLDFKLQLYYHLRKKNSSYYLTKYA